jgi:hypothetical protein
MVVKYRRDQVNWAQCFSVEQAILYHDDRLIPTSRQSLVPNFWLLTMYHEKTNVAEMRHLQ